ncbi:MAG: regulatory protein RecX [Myxococcales bacterium]|nr:MAG: regulatory protein RecX [Myxococcales bacterium]
MPWEGRSGRPSQKAKKAAEPLTRQKLEQAALAYLNRFDVSAAKLRQHLTQRARKAGGDEQAAQWITELLERYLGSGVLDDARFARNLTSQLTARGKSSRAISQKLAMRGVPSEVAGELMAARKQDEPEAELEAARAYARKRRLGPHRPEAERAEHRQKDLASLARQGFSFDTAQRALRVDAGGDDEF